MDYRYWQQVKQMTQQQFEELKMAVLMRLGMEQVEEMFPVDSVVKPKNDHTNHEWHVAHFELSEDYQRVKVVVYDPRAHVTAWFDMEDILPVHVNLRPNRWTINPISSAN